MDSFEPKRRFSAHIATRDKSPATTRQRLHSQQPTQTIIVVDVNFKANKWLPSAPKTFWMFQHPDRLSHFASTQIVLWTGKMRIGKMRICLVSVSAHLGPQFSISRMAQESIWLLIILIIMEKVFVVEVILTLPRVIESQLSCQRFPRRINAWPVRLNSRHACKRYYITKRTVQSRKWDPLAAWAWPETGRDYMMDLRIVINKWEQSCCKRDWSIHSFFVCCSKN